MFSSRNKKKYKYIIYLSLLHTVCHTISEGFFGGIFNPESTKQNWYHIYPKYWDNLTAYHDQMPHSAASDLGLHCLLKPVLPNTSDYYGIY